MTFSETNKSEVETDDKGPKIGIRHWQCLLLFLCGLIAYWTRVNVSIAIVAMTNSANLDFENFDWNEQEKSYILSSFYWGYIFTQLPLGFLGQRYGTKALLFMTIFIPSGLTLLTPLCVKHGGWKVFCALRIIEGFFSGGIFPLFHIHLSKWSPIEERNRLGGFTYSGVEIGTVLSFLISGLISTTSFGWPGIFYIPGIIGMLWCAIWSIYGTNCPEASSSITITEKNYIMSKESAQESCSKPPIPWKDIFRSLPFIALIATRISHSWGFQTLLSETPTYINSVLKMNIKSNAVYSALPYFVMWTLGYVFLVLAEVITKRDCGSLTLIRKSFNTISQWGPAAALIWLAFIRTDEVALAITLLTLAIALGSASTLGSVLNHIDLSPTHSGILMGVVNTAANFISIIVPLIVGEIVTDETNQSQWQIVFLIAAGVYLIGNLIYVIFGEMTKQSWDNSESNDKIFRRESIFLEGPPHILGSK